MSVYGIVISFKNPLLTLSSIALAVVSANSVANSEYIYDDVVYSTLSEAEQAMRSDGDAMWQEYIGRFLEKQLGKGEEKSGEYAGTSSISHIYTTGTHEERREDPIHTIPLYLNRDGLIDAGGGGIYAHRRIVESCTFFDGRLIGAPSQEQFYCGWLEDMQDLQNASQEYRNSCSSEVAITNQEPTRYLDKCRIADDYDETIQYFQNRFEDANRDQFCYRELQDLEISETWTDGEQCQNTSTAVHRFTGYIEHVCDPGHHSHAHLDEVDEAHCERFYEEKIIVELPVAKACEATKNPCIPASGAKLRKELNIKVGSIDYSLNYNSSNIVDSARLIAPGWQHGGGVEYLLFSHPSSFFIPTMIITGNGIKNTFKERSNDDVYQDRQTRIIQEGELWVSQKGDLKKTYDQDGYLSKKEKADSSIDYEYTEEGVLTQISDNFGNSIAFEIDGESRRPMSLLTSNNEKFQFEYDANNNLTAIVFPDVTTSDSSDNPRRIYHYEDQRFPNHLTGITDENGDRHQTYAYDEQGRAISSEKAQSINSVGQERIQLEYQ